MMTKMNAYLEETVAKYLHLLDDYISLTEMHEGLTLKTPATNSKLVKEL